MRVKKIDVENKSSINLDDNMKNYKKTILSKLTEIAKRNREMGQRWPAQAYEKAIRSIREYDQPIYQAEDTHGLAGIGKGIYAKIRDIIENEKLSTIEKVTESNEYIALFMSIYGVNLETSQKWVDKGYTTIDQVVKNEELTQSQKLGIKYHADFQEKIPRLEIDMFRAHMELIKNCINKIAKLKLHFVIVGSYRRGKTESENIDMIIFEENDDIHKGGIIKLLHDYGLLIDDLDIGKNRYTGVMRFLGDFFARRIDIEWVKKRNVPYAVLYFTGSRNFYDMMKQKARERGWEITETGLFRKDGSDVMINETGSGKNNEITEIDVMSKLGIDMKYARAITRD